MRAPLTGTKRKNGTWQIVVTLTTADGRKERKTLYAKTQREVQDKARGLLQENPKRVATPKRTVSDLLDECEAGAWARLSARTQEQYKWARTRIDARFGRLAVSSIDLPMIYAWVKELADTPGLSGRSVQIHRNVLRVALEQARFMGWVRENPAKGWVLPVCVKSRGSEPVSESDALRAIAIEADPHKRLFLSLLWETGMRPAEGSATTAAHLVDLSDTLDVKEKGLPRWWIHVPGTKTDAANRWVPIPDALAQELLDLPEPWFGYDRRQCIRIWHQALVRLGMRTARTRQENGVSVEGAPTLYGLRKGRITAWGDKELTPEVWARLAGHEDVALTRKVYDRPSVERIARQLGR